jgi:PAS domain S-box-containing protein
MGGINQSIFLLSVLLIGQGAIPGQGSAGIALLGVGLLLSWAALPGWTELVMMYPNRVGGIAATCAEAFRPYSPILANLTGVCYWCGWAPACGLTALRAATVINQWCLPWLSVTALAVGIVLFLTFITLCGVKWIMRLAMPMAVASAVLAFLSAVVPMFSGTVDWQQAFALKLTVPFAGWFGQVTSVMAGLYLVCYAAPAFEQAACHVGETIDPNKNVPRAMFASAGLASLFFVVLPVVWLGALGPESIAKDLAVELGPTFAPLLGGAAKAAAVWFIVLNSFQASVAPLAGAARVLSQLAEDGLVPEFMAKRSRTDAPWVATLLTAGTAILIIFVGIPLWLIAATNFTYLIGICLPSVAVWLLRKDQPQMPRPYRAPRGTIALGLLAAAVWGASVILGFQQFGLPTVLAGIAFASLGAALYAWRKAADRRKAGLPMVARTLHVKLTGAMLLVLVLDGAGYLIAVGSVPAHHTPLMAVLADIFVLVALLTMVVGLILPGMIAHAAVEVSTAADKLVKGTLADFTRAMHALAAGDLDAAKASFDLMPVIVHSRDEVGDMALNFNRLQEEIGRAAVGLEGARSGLSEARSALCDSNERLRLAERKFAEEQLQRLRNEQAVILNSIGEGVHWIDLDGNIHFENPAAEKMLGYQPGELIGKPAHATMHHTRADGTPYPRCACSIHATLQDGAVRRVQGEVFWRKDGSSFPVDYTAAPIRDEHGQLVGAVVVFTDITERKKTEIEIERMNKKLVETSRKAGMAEVATSVLHNVGNVLNSVNTSATITADKVSQLKSSGLGRVATLLNEHAGNLPAFFAEHPQGIRLPKFLNQLADHFSSAQRTMLGELTSLRTNLEHINEIVAMQQAYVTSGGIIEVLPVADMVEDALRINAAALEQHGLRVERDLDPSLPPLPIDRNKLLLILVNLIRNAKHACDDVSGSEKCITVSARLNGHGCAKISVRDNGVGIPPENLTRIFEHGFTTRKNGHGFGLHSSALAAREMGGSLRVHSDGPGRGATFTIELPLQRESRAEPKKS